MAAGCHRVVALSLIALLLGVVAPAHARPPHGEILWDRFGVAHVYAKSEAGLFYGYGWAQAQSHGDVLLKLSSVEGMFGPPLEGFHCGATCVVTPVSGHEEYVQHAWNGLIADWDDLRGTARQLDLLARDRALLGFLRTNALETARAWPSWDQSSQFMAGALLAIRREPPCPPGAGAARLLADLRAGLEDYSGHLRERAELKRRTMRVEALIARVRSSAPGRRVLSLRRYRVAQLLGRPLRPLFRKLRRSLS